MSGMVALLLLVGVLSFLLGFSTAANIAVRSHARGEGAHAKCPQCLALDLPESSP